MTFRFMHAADLHLDSPFEGLGKVSPQVAELLRDASLAAYDNLIEAAIENRVAFVLFAGDLYDGEERGVRAQLRFMRGLERLADNGIKAFIVHGNHDPLGGWSAIKRWPEGVTVFGADSVQGVPVEVDGQCVATVFGISYGRRDVTENLALRFPGATGGQLGQGLRVGLLHCNVGGHAEHASYSPCSLADLSAAAIDYWALGHIHLRQVVNEGRPWVVYPGDTQGRSPKPAEQGAKGAMLVEADQSGVNSVQFLPLDTVRFAAVDIDISEMGDKVDIADLRNDLLARVQQLRMQNPGTGFLIRTTLLGRGPLHAELSASCRCEDLLRDLRDNFTDVQPLVWWEDLRNQTRPSIDLDVVRARDDFSACVLKRSEDALGEPAQIDRLAKILTPTSPAELARRCGLPDRDEMAELLEAAALLAVESLEEEAPTCD